MKSKLLFLVCLLAFNSGFAQDKTLSMSAFLNLVAANHPVSKNAKLLSDQARMELMSAWGFFDPKLQATFDTKVSKGDALYGLFYSGLKVPLWFGPDLNLSFERNSGSLLNPESFTGNGILIGGLSMPLGNGLVIDERRNAVKQARIIKDLNQWEQVKIINKLLFQAAKDYCDWYYAEQKLQNNILGRELAQFRLDAVRQRVLTGDMSPLDSVEAYLEWQRRTISLKEAALDIANMKLVVSNYLWTANQIPLELDSTMKPVLPELTWNGSLDSLQNDILKLTSVHPELLKIKFKQDQTKVELQFRKEQLKPTLNLNYNPFSYQPFGGNTLFSTYNYKFGATFFVPLYLRKERGKLGLTKLKLQSLQFENSQLQRDLSTNLQVSFNEVSNYKSLLELQEYAVSNFQKLRDSEQQLFMNGESSLFLVNTRERSLIESNLKREEYRTKLIKAWVGYQYNKGQIGL